MFNTIFKQVLIIIIIIDKESESYQFSYQVGNEYDKIHFTHKQEEIEHQTRGSYKVMLPDGNYQMVEYQVMDKDDETTNRIPMNVIDYKE